MRAQYLLRAWCCAAAVLTGCQTSTTSDPRTYEQKALEIYRTSISYRSAEGHGQIPALAAYLEQEFRAGGFPSEDVHILPYKRESGEETASLVVRYRGDGSSGQKPILLLAHMDVVDAIPENWERDPFTLIEEGGYFFGRGALDNKLGVAMLTATFLRLRADQFVPTRDLIIAFTGDEEIGSSTTHSLVTTHRELTDAEFALNADGGGGVLNRQGDAVVYRLQTSEKTYATFELTIRNPGGHSSMPRSDNAIYELAAVLMNISSYRFPVRMNETTRQYLGFMATQTDGSVADAMRRLVENQDDVDAAEVLSREPEYVGIIGTTFVPTMLDAGQVENALPRFATATLNCRIFPGVEVAEVKAKLLEVGGNDSLDIELLGDPTSSPASPLRNDVTAALTAAIESRFPGTSVVPYMSAGATDGLITRAAGIPTYGVSGVFIDPDDDFSHGLNERVPVASFFGALDHWYILLTTLAGPPREENMP